MKAIMISDKPKWCALMMNGIKNIEVRRNKKALASAIQKLIDENGYVDLYVYCSKNEYLYRTNKGYIASKKPLTVGKGTDYTYAYSDEGKVLFKFRCYKVEEISWQMGVYELEQQWFSDFLDKCCLGFCELKNYLNKKNGYAWHISNLEIFDRPKELNEFKHWVFYKKCDKCPYGKFDYDYGLCSQCYEIKPLTKAPQNYQFIEVEE